MGEWPKSPLGEVAQNFDARRVPLSSRERVKRRGQYPYYGATGVIDHVDDFLFEGLYLLVAEDGSVERPDGKPFLQLVDGRFWVSNHAHVLKGLTDEDTRFLYYALSTVAIRPYISGSVQAKLSQANLNRIPTPYPDNMADRRAIAHILGTLDDKIELNRRMNETLEAMARALFKSWFVDFDPVRAKAEGRLPAGRQATPPAPRPGIWFVYALECEDGSFYIGHTEDVMRRFDEHASGKGAEWTKRHPPQRIAYWEELPTKDAAVAREKKLKTGSGREWLKAEILRRDVIQGGLPKPLADLFPDSFEDSELGEIPRGWEVKTIGDLADVSSGKRPDVRFPEPLEGAAVPLWGGNGPMAFVPEALIDEPILLTGRVGTLGSVFRINTPCWPSDNTLVLRANQRSIFEYLFLQLQLIDFASLDRGSTQPLLTQSDLKAQSLLLPRTEVLERFSSFADRLYKRIDESERESRTLAALRDALLPRLISGELRVKDAERFMERRGIA